jgi:SET domain-containing protein
VLKKLLLSNKIYISKSIIPNAGRGVFAKRDIKKSEVIEKSPIIEVSPHDMANINGSILLTYFFYYGKNKNQSAIALGFGSIYNHSYKPNISYKIYSKEGFIEFIALRDINKGDELTFNYQGGSKQNGKKPLWFEV